MDRKEDYTDVPLSQSPDSVFIISRLWSEDYKTPSVHASVCPCIYSSRFYINLNISFIYKDIFTKFAGNVYGYKNLSLQNFSLILKNKMATMIVEKS